MVSLAELGFDVVTHSTYKVKKRMKYLSVALLFLAMNWSWGLVNHQRRVPQQTHVGIQDDLKKIISDYIQQNLPNSTNLRFERMYTEELSDKKVRAHFTYSFEDSNDQVGEARVQIEGYAILNKSKETPEESEWSFDELVVSNNQVDYKDPIRVSPRPANAAPPATETEAPAAAPEEPKSNE